MRNLKSGTRAKDRFVATVRYIFGIYSSVGILLPSLLLFAYCVLTAQWVLGQRYVVGQPSPQSYISLSEAQYTDEAAMERLRGLAGERVVAVVVKDGETKQEFGVALQMLRNIDARTSSVPINDFPQELFDAVKNLPGPERESILSNVEAAGGALSAPQNEDSDFMHPSERMWQEVDKLNLPPDTANIVYQILASLIEDNVKVDTQLTREFRSQQGEDIPEVERRIEIGDTIVEKGQVVTPQIAVMLRLQGYIGRDFPIRPVVFCSILILLLPFWFNIFIHNDAYRRRPLPWMFISLVIGASWFVEMIGNYMSVVGLGGWFLILSSFVVLPAGISFITSLGGNFVAAFLMIGTSYVNIGLLLFMGVICTTAGYYVMKDLVSRRKIIHRAVVLGLIFVAADVLLRWAIGAPYIWLSSLKLFGFGLVFSFVYSLVLPFIEGVMGFTTPMRLREICHPSVPLLKKLQIEVPGTYQHALTLGSLAETVAAELSLDSNLMKAGAFYHDIGKLKHPLYYVENQLNVGNIQDVLSPPLSAVTIIAHVKEGLDLAAEYGLPAVVRDFIAEHHGTTFLAYFHKKAVAADMNVSKEQFCYPGPKPQSRETALLMLLDSMEAGMRSSGQNISSVADIEKVINRVFDMKLSEGQLDDVNFTYRDLSRIREVMLKAFQSMYHTRKIKELKEFQQDKAQR